MNQKSSWTGSGDFEFTSRSGNTGTMRVFYSCPNSDIRRAPIVIALHGITRDAAGFRDDMAEHCQRNGQIVAVPEFNLQNFPDHYAYNFGGVCLPPPSNIKLPRNHWNFGVIDELFDIVRKQLGSQRTTFSLYGNSAGAQYVLRYLALTDAPAVETAVASNSGAYMLPDLSQDYPAGMGGLDLDRSHLRRYFARRLFLLLGSEDTDPAAPGLPQSDFANAQGPHRLARGQWYARHCAGLAGRLVHPFGWKAEVVEGAGHISPIVYARASKLLAGS